MGSSKLSLPTPARLLGIEGGGTHTVALYWDGCQAARWEGGPANVRLLTDRQLLAVLRVIARQFPRPEAVAIGLAGARTEGDRARIRQSAARCWPGVSCYATNDLETGLAARPAGAQSGPVRVLVLSGTGSCCYGETADGSQRVGGWGHVLGDRGSAYEIGITALRAVIAEYDQEDRWPQLGARLLHRVQLNDPEELIDWAQSAAKDEIAALAIEVFATAEHRDALAAGILDKAKDHLVADAVSCARHLASRRTMVEFVLAGGTLLKQPRFARAVGRAIKSQWPKARVVSLQRESAWGAVELAGRMRGKQSTFNVQLSTLNAQRSAEDSLSLEERVGVRGKGAVEAVNEHRTSNIELRTSNNELRTGAIGRMLSPTEERNPRSRRLDRLSLANGIKLMLSEDARVPAAILAERRPIEQALRLIVRALKKGGRLFYAGAGTSGRLGILDASECPPTFRVPPEMVQGIIAGGRRAIWESVEGAEDDAAAGGRAVGFRGVSNRDVLVGIAASGSTPFVWGALDAARTRGAQTVLLCFNPRLKIEPARRPTVVIAINTGPEILTGSTRLKAGSATKLVLNLFTTLAMVQLGKVTSNLMVDLNPANTKLRDRAVRIVRELTGADYATAQRALEQTGWVVKAAIKIARR